MSIPTDTITHNGANFKWNVHGLRLKHPTTNEVVNMTAQEILADAIVLQHVLDTAVGATPVARKVRTGYKKDGQGKVLNTEGNDYVVNGGTVDYDYDEYYGGVLFKKVTV